ncbi:hypothetical protein [Tamlana sp. I1]|uniref:hypothetical protein n=1 Tax=Tamlana sp. I1 TaxID=2762061 RepID=UPI00188F388F|nr:hypothetical protein [Tamlana sp. I1]
MKTVFGTYKLFAIVISLGILFQSCKVYYKTNTALSDAVLSGSPAKLYTSSDTVFKFKRIVQEDEVFYGLIKSNGQLEKVKIVEDDVKRIRLQNKTMSTVYNVLIPLAVVGGLIAVFAKPNFDSGIEF